MQSAASGNMGSSDTFAALAMKGRFGKHIQLLFWQVVVAAIVLATTATVVEEFPVIQWTPKLGLLFLFGGVVGTVLAYWAMSIVNQRLPAVTTSLGILATPLVGIAFTALTLGEKIELSLVGAAVLIVGGVALGTLVGRKKEIKRSDLKPLRLRVLDAPCQVWD